MSQPTPYSRQYNFTNYQAVNPSTPLPAAQVDLELNSVKATLDQVLNNLKLIQRDDTALANKSVGIDQLKSEVTIGINPPAPWITSHAYIKNDTVTQGGIFYLCLASHTSGTFATDLGAGDWSLIIDFNGIGFDLAGAIHGAVAKTIPNDSDELPLSDSAQVWVLKKATWANIKAAMFTAWGALIAVGTVKSTPADGDAFAYMDSASSNATKVTTWASIKSAMFTAFGPVIAAATAKTTPVLADMLLLVDSAASNVSKMVTLSNFFAAVFTDFGNRISLGTVKSNPVDSDAFAYMDSAAGNATKVTTWSSLKSTIFTALGPLIAAATGKTTPVGADVLLIADSAASNANKGVTFTNLLAFIVAGITTFAKLIGGQTLTGGFDVTPFAVVSWISFTVAPKSGNLQYTPANTGSITITAPATDCSVVIYIVNGAGAVIPTFSGFTVGASTGDTWASTNGNKYFLYITRINGIATYFWKALQ